ncbi:MAG: M1 family metallopeptidase [Bacteroidota bacterium]
MSFSRFRPFFVLCVSLLMIQACKNTPPASVAIQDPHSFAQPEIAKVKHLDLDIQVNFDSSQIMGTATLELEKAPKAKELILDTWDLTIESVVLSDGKGGESVGDFRMGEADPHLGQALIIPLESNTRSVQVTYKTSPQAIALQFLPAELTAGDKPFLLTQSQSVFARTWVPIQDGPGIRFTYHATVKVPDGFLALMSAENPTELAPGGVYEFRMDTPIPAYLLALAVGEIEFASLGARSGVYAEPSVLEAAKYEFAEVEEMITIAEKLYGPYRWGRYDLIILPASFPFGGMENPRLTFATPTILAGDRSLVSLVAHELAHSWSGNLVTNATWNDFWLNEGFTVYFEMRIMEELKGRDYAEMLATISLSDLKEEVGIMGLTNPDTRLALELKGRNPDEGMTSIAYDKGYYFLRLLEETVGRETFDQFLATYFDQNAFQSMHTEAFVERVKTELFQNEEEKWQAIQLEEWIYGTGIPSNLPAPESSRFSAVEDAVKSWIAGVPPAELEINGWSSHEWLHFIRVLPPSIGAEKLAELDSTFQFTQSTNSEVQCRWYLRSVQAKYEVAFPAMRDFLASVGRRKFLKPLYQALMDNGYEEMARSIYDEARASYHPISTGTIDEIVGWEAEI